MAGDRNTVEIVVTSKDRTRPGFESAEKGAGRFQGSFKRIGETAAGFLSANLVANAAQRVKDFVGDSISAASDLNETMSKTDQVFEGNAGTIHSWAQGAVDSMGLSRNAAESMANQMGLTFTQMGFGTGQAAKMSQSWVQLASDIGSFNNADPTEVLDAMSGATRGEYDALQKYVPTISAATVEHEALAISGKKSAEELTAHDKLLGAQKILFDQTTKAQGDFARTGDQNANSQKKAAAAMDNAKAALGKGLLPVTTLAAHVMERLGKIMSAHPGLIMALAAVVGGILVAAFTAWAISAGTAAVATLGAAAPVLAIVAVIALLVAGILLLVKHWHAVWNAIKAAASAVLGWFRAHWPLLLAILTGPIGLAVLVIVRHWDKIKRGAATAWNALVSFVKAIPGRILGALGDLGHLLFQAGRNIIQGLLNGIGSMVGAVGNAVGNVASKIRGFLPFSPAKEGPLSGSGSPFIAGRKIAQMVGEGISAGAAGPTGAMGRALSPLGATAGTGAPGGPGGMFQVNLHLDGKRVAEVLIDPLRGQIRNRGGSVQSVLGRG